MMTFPRDRTRTRSLSRFFALGVLGFPLLVAGGCGTASDSDSDSNYWPIATGGNTGCPVGQVCTGGSYGSGGLGSGTGATGFGTGGAFATGGLTASGGLSASGGVVGSGGEIATGGVSTGGDLGTGGVVGAGRPAGDDLRLPGRQHVPVGPAFVRRAVRPGRSRATQGHPVRKAAELGIVSAAPSDCPPRKRPPC